MSTNVIEAVRKLALALDVLTRENATPEYRTARARRAMEGVNALLAAAEKPAEPTADEKPLGTDFTQSFDARDWAAAFVQHVERNPSIATDPDTMRGWFANAIMRGYDEHAWRRPAEKPAEVPKAQAPRCHDCGSYACIGVRYTASGRTDYCAEHTPPGRAEKPAEPLGGWASDGWASEPAEAAPVDTVPPEVHDRGWQWRPTAADAAFAPPFGTVRACLDCGCLIVGGPSRCARCVAIAPDAKPVVPVKFDADTGNALKPDSDEWASSICEEGWEAHFGSSLLTVEIMLRPGEDAGETVAKMLAACGRGP